MPPSGSTRNLGFYSECISMMLPFLQVNAKVWRVDFRASVSLTADPSLVGLVGEITVWQLHCHDGHSSPPLSLL